MNKITCISILELESGKRLTYTYSVLDANGLVIQSNLKKSFSVEDVDTITIMNQLEIKVNENLQATL